MKIHITRPGVPPTMLHIKLVSKKPEEFGKNKPVAFILPGGPGADSTSYEKYKCLQEVVDLVFHDPRGCGESDKGDPATYSMNNYIDDVDAIRSHLGLQKIIVIGKSYGSMCALGVALRYPANTAKLILAAGAPSYHFIESAKKNIKRIGSPEQIKICDKIWVGGLKDKAELTRYFALTNPLYSVKARTNPGDFDPAKKILSFSVDVLNEGFRREFWHFNYEKELKNITCPTLILAGREDWINDIKCAELMAKHIPNSHLVIFDHAGHAMETDVQEEFFQHIADFIVQ